MGFKYTRLYFFHTQEMHVKYSQINTLMLVFDLTNAKKKKKKAFLAG